MTLWMDASSVADTRIESLGPRADEPLRIGVRMPPFDFREGFSVQMREPWTVFSSGNP